MSSREPMWYCHECNAEMRPLMMPDPHCASCNGTFVEKIDNPQDDPREFHNGFGPDFDLDDGLGPFGFLASLNNVLNAGGPPLPREAERSASPTRHGSTSTTHHAGVRFEFGGPTGRRTVLFGGPNTLNRRDSETSSTGPTNTPGAPPRLSEFLRANSTRSDRSDAEDLRIPGNLMAQYIMALLGGGVMGGRGLSPFFGPLSAEEDGPGSGRWGDYVFTQEALDQIITQLMEGANSTRPVPATDEIIEKLPREVLEEGSPLLEKDCAICKEQFNDKAEGDDEKVVVTLPCKHPFHEGCILPWLKSSGTCPVCRYALVPQPNGHTHGGEPPRSPPSNGNQSGSDRRNPESGNPSGDNAGSSRGGGSTQSGSNQQGHGHGIIESIIQNFSRHIRGGGSSSDDHHSHGPSSPRRSSSFSQSPARSRRESRDNHGTDHNLPGGWGDSID